MLGQVVGRDFDTLCRITVDKLPGSLTWIVRRIEADVHEERIVLTRLRAQMIDRALRPDLCRVLDAISRRVLPLLGVQPLTLERRVPGRPGVAGRRTVVRFRTRLEHPAADLALPLETARQVGFAQVPFTDDERLIAGLAERFTPKRSL